MTWLVVSISGSLTVAWRDTRQGVKVSPIGLFEPREFASHLVQFPGILKRVYPKLAPQLKPQARFLFCGHVASPPFFDRGLTILNMIASIIGSLSTSACKRQLASSR